MGTMGRLVGLVAAAIRFAAAAAGGANRAAAKVSQVEDLGENRGTLSFEGSERLGHGAPPYYLAYTYARKNATTKDKPTSSHIYVAHPGRTGAPVR